MRWFVWHVVLLLLAASLAGCVSRPAEDESIRSVTPQEGVDPWDYGVLPRGADEDDMHTVLALSSGGADGAFGVGVLVGWTKNGTRPQFDVVTGVSTGALISVLAFLGPRYDDLLTELYTHQTNSQIYRNRGVFGLVGQSLYDNEPLKKLIETHVTEKLLAEVAAEHAKGRRLYVATTNIDAGAPVVWDMGDIADGGRSDKLLHFQKILRASSAVPGLFEPVYIKPKRGVQLRQAHVDGAVKTPILLNDFMLETPLERKRVFFIVNGNVKRFDDDKPVKASTLDISRKAISELVRELQEQTIYRDYILSQAAGASFRLVSIPSDFPDADSALDFDPERQRKLFETGQKLGLAGPSAWRRSPERLGALEEVPSIDESL